MVIKYNILVTKIFNKMYIILYILIENHYNIRMMSYVITTIILKIIREISYSI